MKRSEWLREVEKARLEGYAAGAEAGRSEAVQALRHAAEQGAAAIPNRGAHGQGMREVVEAVRRMADWLEGYRGPASGGGRW